MDAETNPWLYPLAMCITFFSVAIRGFQHKNVIGNHMKAILFTASFMAAFEVVGVTMIVKGGLWMIPWVSVGAASGMYVAIKFHDRLFGTKPKQPSQ